MKANMLKNIKRFLVGIILFIVAIVILAILTPWGLVEILISLFWKRRFPKAIGALGQVILLLATLIDVAGNVILQFPLNRVFNNGGYKFGSRFDTISYVLGHGLVHGTLTKSGLIMCNILDKLDKDHCARTYFGRQISQ